MRKLNLTIPIELVIADWRCDLHASRRDKSGYRSETNLCLAPVALCAMIRKSLCFARATYASGEDRRGAYPVAMRT